MGYTTEFEGSFEITPPLAAHDMAELRAMGNYDHGAPLGAPNSYLQWAPSADGTRLAWNGSEKFYDYDVWLAWLAANWFLPRGYTVQGQVRFQGEEIGDTGTLSLSAQGVVSKLRASFDNTPLDALKEIVRRFDADSLEVEDAVALARGAIEKAERG